MGDNDKENRIVRRALIGISAVLPLGAALGAPYRANAQANATIESASPKADTALGNPDAIWVNTVADLMADMLLTYTPGLPGSVTTGTVVRTLEEGFAYRPVTVDSAEPNITNSNPVPVGLTPLPVFGSLGSSTLHNPVAWGADPLGLVDAAPIFNKILGAGYSIVSFGGRFLLNSQVTKPNRQSIECFGKTTFVVADGIDAIFVPGSVEGTADAEPRCGKIKGAKFTHADGAVPRSFIVLGEAMENGIPITEVVEDCDFSNTICQVAVRLRIGYLNNVINCKFNQSTGDAILIEASVGNATQWSYATMIRDTEISAMFIHERGIYAGEGGHGIVHGGGDLHIHGGCIQNNRSHGIVCHADESHAHDDLVEISGTYMEGNYLSDVLSTPVNGAVNLTMSGMRMSSVGVHPARVYAQNTKINANGCYTPGTPVLWLGDDTASITFNGCSQMYNPASSIKKVIGINHVVQTVTPMTAYDFQNQINVNADQGGGGALILCSHQNDAGDATNTELFMVRFGQGGDVFKAESVFRSVGTDTTTYDFTVAPGGSLQVTNSGAGASRYQVIANMRGNDVSL